MRPFLVPEGLAPLPHDYPGAAVLVKAAADGGAYVTRDIALLWLSEGVPWAFRDRAGLFAIVRAWIAREVGIGDKDVTLVGSARVGSSLKPGALGRAFGANSDLDVALVSEPLFRGCCGAFERWAADYDAGTIRARAPEQKFWDDNVARLPENVRRGFIDCHRVPLVPRYVETQRIAETMARLTQKLRVTAGAPQVSRASARVYRDWEAFARQVGRNLSAVADT